MQDSTASAFAADGPPAVQRIRVDGSTMRPRSSRPRIPAEVSSIPIDVSFPGSHEATVGSLVQALGATNLQIAFQWSNGGQGEEILNRKLPFLGFKGTVGELLASLRTGLGIVAWYENGMIFLSDKDRYSISLPQNQELLDTVSKEITSLGATDVVGSTRGGKILYSATPTVQDALIGPFLRRMARNLAVINLQIAVVTLGLNDKSSAGFDWDKFAIEFDSSKKAIRDARRGPDEDDDDDDDTTVDDTVTDETDERTNPVGDVLKIGAEGLSLSRTSLGNVFGTYGALTLAGAINFLNNFGETSVTQNVSLATLSGTEVSIRSGQEVPYVSGVSTTATSNTSGTIGSTQTEKVETGLTIKTTPHYDADSEIVTIDVEVTLKSILDYVELKAGDQIGTITQPLTQDQELTDIVRIQAGRTVVIGGLQYDSIDKSAVEPSLLRDRLEKAGLSLGNRTSDVQRSALFVILRPAVTVYETEE